MDLDSAIDDIVTAVSFFAHPLTNPVRVYELREAIAVLGLFVVVPALLFPIYESITYSQTVNLLIAGLLLMAGLAVVGYSLDVNLRYLRSIPLSVGMSTLDVGVAVLAGKALFTFERAVIDQFNMGLVQTPVIRIISIAGLGLCVIGVLTWQRREHYNNYIKPTTAQQDRRLDCEAGLTMRTGSLLEMAVPWSRDTTTTAPRQQGSLDKFSYAGFVEGRWTWTNEVLETVDEQLSQHGLALVEGQAGSGKSSFLHYYAYRRLPETQIFFFHMGQDLDSRQKPLDTFVDVIDRKALHGSVVVIDDIHRAPIDAESLVEQLQDLSVTVNILMGTRLNFPAYRRQARAAVDQQIDVPDRVQQTFFHSADTTDRSEGMSGDQNVSATDQGRGRIRNDGDHERRTGQEDFEAVEPIAIEEFQRNSLEELVAGAFRSGELSIAGGETSQQGFERQFGLYFSKSASLVLADSVLDRLKRQSPINPSQNVWKFREQAQRLLEDELENVWHQGTTIPDDSAPRHADRFQALIIVWVAWGSFEGPANTALVADRLEIEYQESERLLRELQQNNLVVQVDETDQEYSFQPTHHPAYVSELLLTIANSETTPDWLETATTADIRYCLVDEHPIRVLAPSVTKASDALLAQIGAQAFALSNKYGSDVAQYGIGAHGRRTGARLVNSLLLLINIYEPLAEQPLEDTDEFRLSHSFWAILAIGVFGFDDTALDREESDTAIESLLEQAVDDFVTLAETSNYNTALDRGFSVLRFHSSIAGLLRRISEEQGEVFVDNIVKLGQGGEYPLRAEMLEVLSEGPRLIELWITMSESRRIDLYNALKNNLESTEPEVQAATITALSSTSLYALVWKYDIGESDWTVIDSSSDFEFRGLPSLPSSVTEKRADIMTTITAALTSDNLIVKAAAIDLIGYEHVFHSFVSISDRSVDDMLVKTVTNGLQGKNKKIWLRSVEFWAAHSEFLWRAWDDQTRQEMSELVFRHLQSNDTLSCGPAMLILADDERFEEIGGLLENGYSELGAAVVNNLDSSTPVLRRDAWRVLKQPKVFDTVWGATSETTRTDFKRALLEVIQSPYGQAQKYLLEMLQTPAVLKRIIEVMTPEERQILKNGINNIFQSPLEIRSEVITLYREPELFDLIVGDDKLLSRSEFATRMYESLNSKFRHPDILYVFSAGNQFFTLISYLLSLDSPNRTLELEELWTLPPAFECCWDHLTERRRQLFLETILREIAFPDVSTKADLFRTLSHPEIFRRVLNDAEPRQVNQLCQQFLQLLADSDRRRMVAFEMLAPEDNFVRLWSTLSDRQQGRLLNNVFRPDDEVSEITMRNVALTNVMLFRTVRDELDEGEEKLSETISKSIRQGEIQGNALKGTGFLVLSRRENITWLWQQWSDSVRAEIVEELRQLFALFEDGELEGPPAEIAQKMRDRDYIESRMQAYTEE